MRVTRRALAGGGLAAGALAVAGATPFGAARAQTEWTIEVTGAVATPATYALADLAAYADQWTMTTAFADVDGGHKHVFAGPPLHLLVAAAGPTVDETTMGCALVVVRGEDGYAVVFPWVEISPGDGQKTVLLALTMDGGDLPAEHAPVWAVISDEVMALRSVWRPVSVEVVIAGAASA